MDWTQQPGFQHALSCWNFTKQQIQQCNLELSSLGKELDWVGGDACSPEKYRQGHRVLVTNNWIDPDQLDSSRYEQFLPSWYGMYAGPVEVEFTVPTTKFNCFINRMDPIRQSWLYQLIRRGIFDKGLVSFNMDISRHLTTDTPHDVFKQQFQTQLKIFQTEHDFIYSSVPYRNFDADASLDQVIMQTEFSIVLETYFDRNEVITFSEKIFRCLKLPRPWLMFAMKKAVAYLRDLGFDVLDDVVDHGYDSVEFAIERQAAILDQCQIMCKRKLTDNDIKRCEQAAIHNQSLLDKLFKTFYTDVNISCQNAIKKCLT